MKLTSADRLISYQRSCNDILFVVLTDSSDGLVVMKGTSGPKKEDVSTLN